MNFEVLQLFVRVFSMNLGSLASFGSDTSEQLANISSQKSYFCQITKVFSYESFLLYGH